MLYLVQVFNSIRFLDSRLEEIFEKDDTIYAVVGSLNELSIQELLTRVNTLEGKVGTTGTTKHFRATLDVVRNEITDVNTRLNLTMWAMANQALARGAIRVTLQEIKSYGSLFYFEFVCISEGLKRGGSKIACKLCLCSLKLVLVKILGDCIFRGVSMQEMYDFKLKLTRCCGTTSTDYWNISSAHNGCIMENQLALEEEETEEGFLEDEMSRNIGTIHVCKYDCVFYWKEFVDLQHCPTCGETRYKVNHNRGKKFLHKHRDKRIETDDVLRHPANAEGWKHFDSEFPNFAFDPWNVHLGLASDGFNLFGHISQFFQLHTTLLWKINDFLEYGDLSGWSTKGYQASCMGHRLLFGIQGRISFLVHRRNLLENHVWCRSRLYNEKVEHMAPPVVMNGTDVDPTIIEGSVMHHVTDDFIDDVDEHFMSSFQSGFDEMDAMFLEFVEELDNPAEGSLSVGDNSGESNANANESPNSLKSPAHKVATYPSRFGLTALFNHRSEGKCRVKSNLVPKEI
ncbi:hypothetical protein E6C27_scaffold418G00480 [Cucumis melo var. makuwa]|uniref:CACTA en-spm transposon protein n=1 Tax=Cucumis melo var. makuwa TaxID=1194695 RepID=A0A5A7VLA7_CUCMM|nr:hypothetical protein E6C27_scaffold418G00480 [Cucumis melo var. makuwa]